ncbi:lamin tail domain-containing protein [Fontisphaera persica]|uniref:lamin tail domain-containing protein n=1 Tax=Fontisphaera persica TaxID=2974023 RepID=UPI0024BF2841|nr:lamin tail domain-containing protein [Fontisphaera persica]WCJ60032.1 lamin tail domain-containing protein [Fontisphaera persica]
MDNYGEREPWVELYNGGSNAVDLTGWYLANQYTNLGQWAFPAGTVLGPGEYRVVWCDGQEGQSAGTNLHTNFRLSGGAGSVALVMPVDGGLKVLDYLNYTNLAPDQSYGDYPNGQMFYRQKFMYPTPGWANNTDLALPVVRINEWMADNTLVLTPDQRYEDWFELYNPTTNFINLQGLYLSDNPSNKLQFRIPAGYTIPPRGYLLVWADNRPELNSTNEVDLHVNFALARRGESIGLYGPDGSVIDEVTFGDMTGNVVLGRYPDGSSLITTLSRPTPRGANVASITPGNTPPQLAPLPNRSLLVGQTLQLDLVATDVDQPPQNLAFSFLPPTPVSVTLTNGNRLRWTPTLAEVGTHQIVVRVTDDGTPPMSATNTLQVTVGALPQLPPGGLSLANGRLSLTFATVPGVTYRLQYKQQLTDAVWLDVAPPTNAAGATITLQDNLTAPQRFYRLTAE